MSKADNIWTLDGELRSDAVAQGERAIGEWEQLRKQTASEAGEEADAASQRCYAAQQAAAAVGSLWLLGCDDDVARARASTPDPVASVISDALAGVAWDELERAITELAVLVPQLDDAAGKPSSDLLHEILAKLDRRDDVEKVLVGCEQLQEEAPTLAAEAEAVLLAVDELLSEQLWRLLPLGELRNQRVEWVAPSRRRRLWWWARGAHLPPNALEAMSTTAGVIAAFPEARAELEQLVAAEREIVGLIRSAENERSAPVVSIAEALKRRRSVQVSRDSKTDTLALAASEGERVLHACAEFVVSIDDEQLLVDYEEGFDPVAGRPPWIEASGAGRLRGVEQHPGSFSFALSAPELRASSGKLGVPVGAEDVLLSLPELEP